MCNVTKAIRLGSKVEVIKNGEKLGGGGEGSRGGV